MLNNTIKHYAYLGHWVYFVVDTVYIAYSGETIQ